MKLTKTDDLAEGEGYWSDGYFWTVGMEGDVLPTLCTMEQAKRTFAVLSDLHNADYERLTPEDGDPPIPIWTAWVGPKRYEDENIVTLMEKVTQIKAECATREPDYKDDDFAVIWDEYRRVWSLEVTVGRHVIVHSNHGSREQAISLIPEIRSKESGILFGVPVGQKPYYLQQAAWLIVERGRNGNNKIDCTDSVLF